MVQKIFLTKDVAYEKIGKSRVTYSFDFKRKLLTFFWNNKEVIKHHKAKAGQALAIKVDEFYAKEKVVKISPEENCSIVR